jgi:hypothetical protein
MSGCGFRGGTRQRRLFDDHRLDNGLDDWDDLFLLRPALRRPHLPLPLVQVCETVHSQQ